MEEDSRTVHRLDEEEDAGTMSFAEKLYEIYRSRSGNALISPYSIAIVLHMAREGAKGRTLDEMSEVLGEKPEFIDSEKLAVANAIWLRCKIKEDWKHIVTHTYRAETRDISKYSVPEKQINAWANIHTKGRIPRILNEGQLDPEDKIVITNAIHFKDLWLRQFKEANTKKEPFFVSPINTVDVELMHLRGHFRYGETKDLQILEMFYEDKNISMVILLPKTKAEKVKSIKYIGRLYRREVIVYLPKLLMRKSYSLRNMLIGMGMKVPFSDLADFSKMTTDTAEGGVKIGDVIHKTFVEINEEGTEAAAVTAGVMRTLSAMAPPPVIPVTFRADHPYVFLIKHVPTNTVLFIGKVDNPLEAG
jgi:serpin B